MFLQICWDDVMSTICYAFDAIVDTFAPWIFFNVQYNVFRGYELRNFHTNSVYVIITKYTGGGNDEKFATPFTKGITPVGGFAYIFPPRVMG